MNGSRKFLLIVFLIGGLFYSVYSFSQAPSPEPTTGFIDQWRREGQFVTIQISRKNPVRIFVVGKEEAKIDPKTLQLTVRRIKPYPGKVLNVTRSGEYYVIPDAEMANAQTLELTAKIGEKTEKFQFDAKEKP